MRNSHLLLFFLFILFNTSSAQNTECTWNWARSSTNNTTGNNQCTAIAIDPAENIYAVGTFDDRLLEFGSVTLTNTPTPQPNTWWTDYYIAKYDSEGKLLWAKSEGGSNHEDIAAIVMAGTDFYVLGNFNSPVLTIGTYTLTSKGGGDIFLAKYDSSGNALWATNVGGSEHDGVIDESSLAIDANGNLYIAGVFSSPSLVFGTQTLTRAGSNGYDIMLLKYDSNGNPVFAKGFGGSGYDHSVGVMTDNSGNIFLSGYFASNSITFGAYTLSATMQSDVFLAKLGTTGNVLWVKSGGSQGVDEITGMAMDDGGNVYVSGPFGGTSITFDNFTLAGGGNGTNIFTCKYNTAGDLVWAKKAGGELSENPRSMALNNNGDVYITGSFTSRQFVFGTDTLVNSFGGDNYYIAAYNSNGTELWAIGDNVNGTSEIFEVITSSPSGNVYAGGSFSGVRATFGSLAVDSSGFGLNLVLAKYCNNYLGVDDIKLLKPTVAPNPFDLYTNITLSDESISPGNKIALTATDALGRQVQIDYTTRLNGKSLNFQVSRSGLKPGIYFFTINEGARIIGTGKFVVASAN